jgi:superfamily II DNA/RNA helicase
MPWRTSAEAAKIMKKPGIAKADAASLGYLSLDDSKLTPLAQHLPLPNRVVSQLYKRGVKKASPIQEAVFSDIYRGKSLCLQSQTGTGKTLAMVLPLLTAMSEESQWGRDGDKIVVITSCRELAVQLFSDIDSMGFFPKGQGFATMVIVGNVPPSEAMLNANVIIGTPNELGGLLHKDNDIVRQMNTKLRGIILDEARPWQNLANLAKYPLKNRVCGRASACVSRWFSNTQSRWVCD